MLTQAFATNEFKRHSTLRRGPDNTVLRIYFTAESETIEGVFRGVLAGLNAAIPATLKGVAALKRYDECLGHIFGRWPELNQGITARLILEDS